MKKKVLSCNFMMSRVYSRNLFVCPLVIYLFYLVYVNYNRIKVNVYVIDSEIDINHREFGNRADIVYSTEGVSNCKNPISHGTHVAGIIGGNTVGIDSSVLLHSVNVLDCNGTVDNLELAKAIEWVVENHVSPAIIVMSLIPDDLILIPPLDDAIKRAIDSGIIFVSSAGNNGINRCDFSPLRVVNNIIVGSVSENYIMSDFSNYGDCVTVYSYGEDIFSASRGGGYESLTGTSQSTPYVSGVIAKYLKTNPTANQVDVIDYLNKISLKIHNEIKVIL
jgi:subtilisin family serine protease